MYDVAVRGPTVIMEETETAAEVATSGVMSSTAWGMAAEQYRQLLQHQHRPDEDEGAVSDAGSAASRGPSPLGSSDVEGDTRLVGRPSPDQGVIEKLKRQVASVTHTHALDASDESSDYRLSEARRHRLSPQSLLAASMAAAPPSLVPLPGLTGLTGYGGGGVGRAGSVSPPAREAASPPTSSSAGHSPRQPSAATGTPNGAAAQAPWNYEEQFKQLYEIDDNPKRKEFLDELFRFMQNRGTPINRLPIMAKQVLDMYELYNLVVARGGLVEVINKKLWQEIIKGLKLPSSITSAAFTLRTQYMKYLYPHECQKEGLSSPADLQAAIDGNRREGRRPAYSAPSYADFGQRPPMIASPMGPSFGLGNGMPLPTTLHQQGLSPLSLVTSRAAAPGSNGPAGHPMPPSSPFLPGMGGPVLPSANDTLMTLWNLYSRQQHQHHHQQQQQQQQQQHQQQQQQQQRIHSPPAHRKPELPAAARRKLESPAPSPQCEALNLGIPRDTSRDELSSDADRSTDRGLDQDSHMSSEKERAWERHLRIKQEGRTEPVASPPPASKRFRPADPERSADAFPHTKMSIATKGDSSIVVSMELNGVGYQGVLFAQPRTASV